MKEEGDMKEKEIRKIGKCFADGVFASVLIFLIVFLLIILVMNITKNVFELGVNSTDKDGWNRSGFELLTDYGTGKEYLVRGSAIIERSR